MEQNESEVLSVLTIDGKNVDPKNKKR